MECINCHGEISEDSLSCPICGNEANNTNIDLTNVLDDKKIYRYVNILGKIIKIITAGPFLLIGILFFIIGCYCTFDEKQETKNYAQTYGQLVDYEYDTNGYTGIYQYTVDGQNYTISPNRISDKSDFKENEIVKYNPDNPSQSVIYANWEWLIISGLVMIIISLIIVFSKSFKYFTIK